MRETGAGWETDDMASELMTAGLPLGGALTLVGLIISFFVWRSKGAAAGLRGVSWSLVPLAAGLLVMFLFYTGWGLLEIYSLPKATLP